ncbi:MAG: hypothetical protein FJY88_02960 [Candidatus Eisenbacteria bacterium]|nr:hypothetical protein [Candidatus Eisenbacteria bacterium]
MRSRLTLNHILVLGLVTCLTAGCGTSYTLSMQAHRDPLNDSVVTAALKGAPCRKVMVIPPSGTIRGKFDRFIALFEKELMRAGVTVVSGAVTGRIVLSTESDTTVHRVEAARPLSDAERALVMAEGTGAEALFQLGDFEWEASSPTRFFAALPPGSAKQFIEVSRDEYNSTSRLRRLCFESQKLRFTGRLTDLQSGTLLASLDVSCPMNYTLPEDYVARFRSDSRGPDVEHMKENFAYKEGSWVEQARGDTEIRVIRLIAALITGR